VLGFGLTNLGTAAEVAMSSNVAVGVLTEIGTDAI